jgi:hypothetical protein
MGELIDLRFEECKPTPRQMRDLSEPDQLDAIGERADFKLDVIKSVAFRLVFRAVIAGEKRPHFRRFCG